MSDIKKIKTEAFCSWQVIWRFFSQAQMVSTLEIDHLTVLNELANSDPVAVLRGSIVDIENPQRWNPIGSATGWSQTLTILSFDPPHHLVTVSIWSWIYWWRDNRITRDSIMSAIKAHLFQGCTWKRQFGWPDCPLYESTFTTAPTSWNNDLQLNSLKITQVTKHGHKKLIIWSWYAVMI